MSFCTHHSVLAFPAFAGTLASIYADNAVLTISVIHLPPCNISKNVDPLNDDFGRLERSRLGC